MDLKQLKQAVLKNDGATWEFTRNGHIMVRLHGVAVCTIPKTASEYRSLKNSISQLRRGGVDIPRK